MKFSLNIYLAILVAIFQLSFGHYINSRIAHGHEAVPHSAPYIISLQVEVDKSYIHFCDGVILSYHWILTAGHCFSDKEYIPNMLIKAGRHNITHETEITEQIRKIEWFKVHQNYGLTIGPNDLTLIYIKKPFVWTETVKPINLPDSNKIHTGIGTLFGWGCLNETIENYPDNLQTVDIPIISTDQCLKDFPQLLDYLDLITNICTVDEIGCSACEADSGGPLVQNNTENQIELIGIVSSGPQCGVPYKSVSIYVRVSSFIDWIENTQNEYLNRNLV